jgi:hypothetical protein
MALISSVSLHTTCAGKWPTLHLGCLSLGLTFVDLLWLGSGYSYFDFLALLVVSSDSWEGSFIERRDRVGGFELILFKGELVNLTEALESLFAREPGQRMDSRVGRAPPASEDDLTQHSRWAVQWPWPWLRNRAWCSSEP